MTEWRNDPLDELRSELRSQVGGEFRRAAEDDELAAQQRHLRNRSLADVAHELVARGDTVQISFGGERFVGTVIYARGTLATLETQDKDEVHINLEGPVVLRVTRRATDGGRTPDPLGPESFVAKLRQLELEGGAVLLSLPEQGQSVRCRIDAVATDHLMATDLADQTWFIPFHQIASATHHHTA